MAPRTLAVLVLSAPVLFAVDHSKFRTCAQTNFCVRKRTAEPGRAYVVGPSSISLSSNTLSAELHGGPWGVPLTLQVLAYDTGVAAGADVVVFTELTVTGYPPEDLLL